MCVLSRFSRVRLCGLVKCSPPGSSVHGVLQARIMEWVAMPSSSPVIALAHLYICICFSDQEQMVYVGIEGGG